MWVHKAACAPMPQGLQAACACIALSCTVTVWGGAACACMADAPEAAGGATCLQ